MKQLKSAALAAALALVYAGSAAAEQVPGFYAGIGIGQSTIEVDDFDLDEDDTGFKVFGGYQFNQYVAAELEVVDLGEASDTQLGVTTEVEVTQVNLSAVGTFAFNEVLGAMGRVGVSFLDAEARQSFLGASVEVDDEATELYYGLGLWFTPTKQFLFRLEYEMTEAEFDGTDADLSLISVSAAYRFGR